MHTCISSHGLKRSWRSCPRRVNAGNKNTPSTHHPRRRNVTTLMIGLKNGHIRKNLTPKSGEPQRYSWGTQKKKKKKKSNLNSVKLSSWAVPLYHIAHGILHMINARCVACDLCTIAPWPFECTSWRHFAAQCKKISNCTFQCDY